MTTLFVVAVSSDALHRFSKNTQASIRLIKGHGVEGDAHAGPTVQHRYLARRGNTLPNLRQVHLIASEVFEALAKEGFTLGPGELGENITTCGVDLLTLPLGSRMRLGATAVVTLTGLRTPCGLIDKFQKGLKRRLVLPAPSSPQFRAGVMGIVSDAGTVRPGDPIAIELPLKRVSSVVTV